MGPPCVGHRMKTAQATQRRGEGVMNHKHTPGKGLLAWRVDSVSLGKLLGVFA